MFLPSSFRTGPHPVPAPCLQAAGQTRADSRGRCTETDSRQAYLRQDTRQDGRSGETFFRRELKVGNKLTDPLQDLRHRGNDVVQWAAFFCQSSRQLSIKKVHYGKRSCQCFWKLAFRIKYFCKKLQQYFTLKVKNLSYMTKQLSINCSRKSWAQFTGS